MKFTNGYWMMREGMKPHFAVEYAGHEEIDGAWHVYAAARPVKDRGDTLNSTLLTFAFTSPAPGCVRVEVIHHSGANQPVESLVETMGDGKLNCADEGDFLVLDGGGGLSVAIDKRPGSWNIDFTGADGERLTDSGWRGTAYIQDGHTKKNHMVVELGLAVNESIYGLGERFTPFVKNGQSVALWNADGGTASEQAYKNIPFYLSSRGYGVLVDSNADVEYEIASEKVSRVQFSLPRERLAFVLIAGPKPEDVIGRLTDLTGKPALPPAWSFGLWLTTSFTTDYSEETVNAFVDGMLDRDIPLSVFHFDCFWMRGYHWCDFTWDPAVFPDPAGMLARLKARGIKICVWINPYIAQRSALFREGMDKGFLLKKRDGSVWQTDLWQPGMALVDFTNPEATAWYVGQLRVLLDMGVDCFKTDFGERVPVKDIVWHSGADPVCMHNHYAYLFNQAVFGLLEETKGTGEACVFARSAASGSQKFPVHWGGDCTASYASMAETLRGGLSLALCGFGFWSHDIGGFENTATADLYKRWCAFGLLSSHSRLHGSGSYRVPWLFDEEACDVLRHFTRLKNILMPYLYGQAVRAVQTGAPLLRPMIYDFPDDPICRHLDTQYMLGESLLVAPVFSDKGDVSFYLPEGRWTNYLTGEVREGGRFFRETHDYFSLPLYVRPHTALVTGGHHERPDYDYTQGLAVRLYELEPGTKSIAVPDQQGRTAATVTIIQKEDTITVTVSSVQDHWQIILPEVEVERIEGGESCQLPYGVQIHCRAETVIIKMKKRI